MTENNLVPEHKVLSAEEAQDILVKYNVKLDDMPKIRFDDPSLEELERKIGDIIMIIRKNPFIGDSYYYRVVVDG